MTMRLNSYQQLSKVSMSQLLPVPLLLNPVECAGNLAAWFENHMSMDTHVVRVCSL